MSAHERTGSLPPRKGGAGTGRESHHARRVPPCGAGFTLIEMMVALAVFGLAALALLRLEGAAVRTASQLEAKAVGQLVARNQGVLAMTDVAVPPDGVSQGSDRNAGRDWRWTRTVRALDGGGVARIDIDVRDESGAPAGALTLFRAARR